MSDVQILPLLLVVLAVLAGVPMVRHRDPGGRAVALRRTAFGWTVAVAVLGGAFIAAEAGADPGGASAVLLVLAWLVPLGVLGWMAWWHPTLGQRVLTVALAGVLLSVGWTAIGWQVAVDARNARPPYDAIAVFVLCAALGVLGWHRPRPAGVMLLVAAVAPVLLDAVSSAAPLRAALGGAMAAAALPAIVTGVLYLLCAHYEQAAGAVPPHQRLTPAA